MPDNGGESGRAPGGQGGRNGGSESIAGAVTEVSERLSRLVHDEIDLAKAEIAQKATSLLRGVVAVAAGAVFGVFAVIFFLLTLAWVLDGIFVSDVGDIWLGFLIVLGVLVVMMVGSFLFAWRKLKVGAPTPTMAIDEAKKIRETMSASGDPGVNGAPSAASAAPANPSGGNR